METNVNDDFYEVIEKLRSTTKEDNLVLRNQLKTILTEKPVLSWASLLFKVLGDQDAKIQETVIDLLESELSLLLENQKELVPVLINNLKSHLVKDLSELFKKNHHFYVLKVWGFVVTLLGESLHVGTSLVNSLLEIVEMAFKCSNAKTRLQSYLAWQHLIDNFALNAEVIGNQKRLKLLLQPLKGSNFRTESGAVVRCKTWWHLLWSLGEKLTPNLEQACLPLLNLCFPGLQPASSKSPAAGCTPRPLQENQTSAYGHMGKEIVARLLEQPAVLGSPSKCGGPGSPKHIPRMTIPSLRVPLGQMAFVKYADILLRAAKEALMKNANEQEESPEKRAQNEELSKYILSSVVARVSSISEDFNQEKAEVMSSFIYFCGAVISEKLCSHSTIMVFLEEISLLSPRLLNCRGIKPRSPGKLWETPVLTILSLLLHKSVTMNLTKSDRFFVIYNRLLGNGPKDGTLVLDFAQSVLNLLVSDSVQSCEREICTALWLALVNFLTETISETQEVNQGTDEEPDFYCIVSALLYPVRYLMRTKCNQEVMKVWSHLFRTFSQCSALIPSTEVNASCEEVCKQLWSVLPAPENNKEDLFLMENISQLLIFILNSFNWFSVLPPLKSQSLPPLKSRSNLASIPLNGRSTDGKKNQLGNFASFVGVTVKIARQLMHIIKQGDDLLISDKVKVCQSNLLSNMLDIFTKLFKNSKTPMTAASVLSECLPSITTMFQMSSQKPVPRLFSLQIMNKLEGVLSSITLCMRLYCPGPYDDAIVSALSPLLEVTLMHPRRNFRDQTRELWFSTMWMHYHALKLPDSLKCVLIKVRPSLIPGIEVSPPEVDVQSSFLTTDTENTNSQESKEEPAAHKLLGSFLNKNSGTSPKQDQSPRCTIARKLFPSIEEMDSEDFVRIDCVSQKKTTLTEHQKEVLKTKSYVPALYNDLSQNTQDSPSEIEWLSSENVQSNSVSSLPSSQGNEAVVLNLQENDELVTIASSETQMETDSQIDDPVEVLSCRNDKSDEQDMVHNSEVSNKATQSNCRHQEESSVTVPTLTVYSDESVDCLSDTCQAKKPVITISKLTEKEIESLSQSYSQLEVPETELFAEETAVFESTRRKRKRKAENNVKSKRKRRKCVVAKLTKPQNEEYILDDDKDIVPRNTDGQKKIDIGISARSLEDCIPIQEKILDAKDAEVALSVIVNAGLREDGVMESHASVENCNNEKFADCEEHAENTREDVQNCHDGADLDAPFLEAAPISEIFVESPTMQALISSPVKKCVSYSQDLTIENAEIVVEESGKDDSCKDDTVSKDLNEGVVQNLNGLNEITGNVDKCSETMLNNDYKTNDGKCSGDTLDVNMPDQEELNKCLYPEKCQISAEVSSNQSIGSQLFSVSPNNNNNNNASPVSPPMGARKRKMVSPKTSPVFRQLRSRIIKVSNKKSPRLSKPHSVTSNKVKQIDPKSLQFQSSFDTCDVNGEKQDSSMNSEDPLPLESQFPCKNVAEKLDTQVEAVNVARDHSYVSTTPPKGSSFETRSNKSTEQRSPKQTSPLPTSVCRIKAKSIVLPLSPLSRSHRILQASLRKSAPGKLSQKQLFKKTVSLSPTSDGIPHSPNYSRHAYSPNACPPCGILKKSRSAEDNTESKQSPSTKRCFRVSFAEPLVHYEQSKAADRRSKQHRNLNLDRYLYTSVQTPSHSEFTNLQRTSQKCLEDSSCWPNESELSASYHGTQTQDMESEEMLYPELVDCKDPITLILPSLTSSVWAEGLAYLLQSRNITTIGDLSRCSPAQVMRLPFRSPKVDVARKALRQHLYSKSAEDPSHPNTLEESKSIEESEEASTSGNETVGLNVAQTSDYIVQEKHSGECANTLERTCEVICEVTTMTACHAAHVKQENIDFCVDTETVHNNSTPSKSEVHIHPSASVSNPILTLVPLPRDSSNNEPTHSDCSICHSKHCSCDISQSLPVKTTVCTEVPLSSVSKFPDPHSLTSSEPSESNKLSFAKEQMSSMENDATADGEFVEQPELTSDLSEEEEAEITDLPKIVCDAQQSKLICDTQQSELITDTQQSELISDTQQSELITDTQQSELIGDTQQSELVNEENENVKLRTEICDRGNYSSLVCADSEESAGSSENCKNISSQQDACNGNKETSAEALNFVDKLKESVATLSISEIACAIQVLSTALSNKLSNVKD